MSFLDFNSYKLTSFEPSEFYSDSFSVDEFIQQKRYSVPLDVLRDDLGSHLKSLRSSLIELINQDYGQFVNLSSNLVGLDGKIQNIVGPLSRAESDIQKLHNSLEQTIEPLQGELEKRRSIRTKQTQLQFLRRAHSCLESSEKYLEQCAEDILTSGDFKILKIACDKLSDTRQLIQRCLPSPLLNKLQTRLESCCAVVLSKLEALLRAYANTVVQNVEMQDEDDRCLTIKSILFMFSQLQWEVQAENTYVNDILKPRCDTVLAKKGNISALLSEIETFIHHSSVLPISRQIDKYPWMKKFDFLGHAVFPHVVNILIKQFPHIWSPSTPDLFHSNWIRCSAFIDQVEMALPSLDHLHSFRSSAILKEFLSKWQFNVYFQLRFHTLSIELESSLEAVHSKCSTPDYKLDATRVLVKVISQCWDKEKIFIEQLSGRFIKASALFISRYLKEIVTQVASNPKVTTNQLISVFADLTICELILGQIIMDKISNAMFPGSYEANIPGQTEGTGDTEVNSENPGAKFLSSFNWKETQDRLESRLVDLTVAESTSSISSVNEVPRLFRRTNREVPTKHSEYVNVILKPVEELQKNMKEAKQGDLFDRVGRQVGQQVINRYKVQMDEVLMSVQRMEESLKRLKKVKGQSQIDPTTNENNCDSKMNNPNLSDDNKIRRQIQLDHEYLTAQIRSITFLG